MDRFCVSANILRCHHLSCDIANDLVFFHALDDDEEDKDNGNGDDDIRGGPHLHDCPLCKQSVKSADHKHSSSL